MHCVRLRGWNRRRDRHHVHARSVGVSRRSGGGIVRGAGRTRSADLLETIRRYADRTILFCQAGAISIPAYRAALTFVEQTVVEVCKPDGGLFHPKSWIVRFTSGRGRVRHRVLVMSRNLTFDRAWDVLVRLDEDPECSAAIDAAPLVDFIAGVAGATARPLTLAQQELVVIDP